MIALLASIILAAGIHMHGGDQREHVWLVKAHQAHEQAKVPPCRKGKACKSPATTTGLEHLV